MADETLARIPPPLGGCEECDAGFVLTETNETIPCAACRPETFARWAEGSYRPSFESKPPPRATGDTSWKGRRDVDL